MKNNITYIAGGGGSPACYIHLGILKEFIKQNKKVVDQVGTSAGSIVGAYTAVKIAEKGCIEESDIEWLVNQEFKNFKDYNIFGLAWFYICKFLAGVTPINKVGIFKGNALHEKLKEITKNMKFSDLSDDFNLYITATEILTGNLIIFSKKTTPDVLIADGVRASCGIQGAFAPFGIDLDILKGGIFINNSIKQPFSLNNEDHFDPQRLLDMYGISKNKKIFLVDGGNNGNCRTDIGSNIRSDDTDMVAVSFTYNGEPTPITQTNQLLGQSISILMQATENLVIEYAQLKMPDIKILRPDTLDVGCTDFDVSLNVKHSLMNSGVMALSHIS